MQIAFFGDSLTQGTLGSSYFENLKQKLPNHNLLNYGKNGDTVLSLYRRMKKIEYKEKIDITFLWIGTNDILVNISWTFPIIKTIFRQPWSKDCYNFGTCYQKILNYLQDKTKKVITIPPIFIGEDLNNPWNKELEKLSETIQEISKKYDNTEYFDLRKIFSSKQKTNKKSDYLQKSTIGVAFDELLLKTPDQIDKKAHERGLTYTLDGVHLNSHGAQIVTDSFLKKIKELEK